MPRNSRSNKYRRFSVTGTGTIDQDSEETSRDRAIGDDWIGFDNLNRSVESPEAQEFLVSPYAAQGYSRYANGFRSNKLSTNGHHANGQDTNGHDTNGYTTNGATVTPYHAYPVITPKQAPSSLNTTDHSGSFSSLNPCGCSLCQRFLDFIADHFAAGSISGAVFNMCISTVGAGALALPYAVRSVGLIFGLIFTIVCAFWAYFTLDLLLVAAEYLPEELRGTGPQRNISYQTLAIHSYGHKLSRALQVLMAIQYFGSFIGYVVAFAGFFDLVYKVYDHPEGWPDSIYTMSVVTICYCIVFPLSLLRTMNSLRFTSFLGFSMAIYLVKVVCVEYFLLCSKQDDHPLSGVGSHYSTTCVWEDDYSMDMNIIWPEQTFEKFYSGFLTAAPLLIFAYTCNHFILPVYNELNRPSIHRMRKVHKRGLSIIAILYTLIALFGFLLFLDTVCSNVLLNDFRRHFDVVLAALGMAICSILTMPIYTFNFRRMMGMLLWNKASSEITTVWHVVISFLFVTANVALGVSIKSIATVFGFLGSTTVPILGFILPAAFFCKLTPPGKFKVRKTIAVIQAVIVAVICGCSLVYKGFYPDDKACDAAQSIG